MVISRRKNLDINLAKEKTSFCFCFIHKDTEAMGVDGWHFMFFFMLLGISERVHLEAG